MTRNLVLAAIAACAMLVFSGCAHNTGKGLETIDDAALSFDGMVPVKIKSLDRAWVREGISLASFPDIIFQTAEIQYRPVEPFTRRVSIPSNRTEFPISEANQERLQKMLSDTFTKELEKSNRFNLVREKGPGVLMVRVTLLDVVSNVPPELTGQNDIYLSSVGEATLVIELLDSESNTILARAEDRQAADAPGWDLQRSSSVTNWAEAQRVVRTWATILRSLLDNVAEGIDSEK